MVTKKKPQETPVWVVFAVKILLVLVILFMLPKLVDADSSRRRRRNEFEIRTLRTDCAKNVCSRWIPEESLNCIFLCVSPACYDEVYGLEPLEDGEIDLERSRLFHNCVKQELRMMRQRKFSQAFLDASPYENE